MASQFIVMMDSQEFRMRGAVERHVQRISIVPQVAFFAPCASLSYVTTALLQRVQCIILSLQRLDNAR
jgi:hypothetical protein